MQHQTSWIDFQVGNEERAGVCVDQYVELDANEKQWFFHSDTLSKDWIVPDSWTCMFLVIDG